jgi:predicted transcriptional regulator
MGKMSVKKRDRLAVIFDILKIISDNHNTIKPTPLLRFSNLSSNSFAEYYEELLEKGLIKEIIDNKKKKYLTLTDKGFKYLEKYQLILGFISEFEL